MDKLFSIIRLFALMSGIVFGLAVFCVTPFSGVLILIVAIIWALLDPLSLMGEEIKVKYFEPDLEPIQKFSIGDWIDLRAAERVELKAGESRIIRLGVGMILPKGYEALVLPRSSTPTKFGVMLANSMGVIDNSYSGDGDEWKFSAYAIRDTVIEKGDRIAQFRIVKNQPRLTFNTVTRLNKKDRGGFGSTGTR